jgi:outer membrane lipoprotein SlyB
MKRHLVFAVVALAMTAVQAEAKGCIKGAVVGGIAGHAAGHHAVIGAVSGCIVGHHLAKKHEEEMQAPANGTSQPTHTSGEQSAPAQSPKQ